MGSPLGVIATIGGVYHFSTSGLGFKTTFILNSLLFCFFECLKIHRQNKYSGHC
jgi:hypothetical protein